jgi:hypothetical protein
VYYFDESRAFHEPIPANGLFYRSHVKIIKAADVSCPVVYGILADLYKFEATNPPPKKKSKSKRASAAAGDVRVFTVSLLSILM